MRLNAGRALFSVGMDRFKRVLRERRRQWHEALTANRVARIVVVGLDPGVRFNPAQVPAHANLQGGVYAVALQERAGDECTRQA